MINGTEWLVVTKMDVLDECAEIPVCIGYKIDGKVTRAIPADMRGFEAIEPVYTTLQGWRRSTDGITDYDKLPDTGEGVLGIRGEGVGRQRSAWCRPVRTASRR